MCIDINISQDVAILVDGNNMEMSISNKYGEDLALDYLKVIPKLLNGRNLNRLRYFREGKSISDKLAKLLHENFYGVVVPCHKSADVPIAITATQLAKKVDTVILLSGDVDYVELVNYLKNQGVRVEVASFRGSTSHVLIKKVDHHMYLNKKDTFKIRQPKSDEKPKGESIKKYYPVYSIGVPNKEVEFVPGNTYTMVHPADNKNYKLLCVAEQIQKRSSKFCIPREITIPSGNESSIEIITDEDGKSSRNPVDTINLLREKRVKSIVEVPCKLMFGVKPDDKGKIKKGKTYNFFDGAGTTNFMGKCVKLPTKDNPYGYVFEITKAMRPLETNNLFVKSNTNKIEVRCANIQN